MKSDYSKSLYEDYQKLLIENEKLKKQNAELKYKRALDLKVIFSLQKENEILKNDKNKISKEFGDTLQELSNSNNKIGSLQSILNNDASNSGISTEKTSINKKKRIPNSRVKSDKKKGGQLGHTKAKLEKFSDDEITNIEDHIPQSCKFCSNLNIVPTGKVIEKDELDYEIMVKKTRHKFYEYICNDCNKKFCLPIPNNLKEDNQYGPKIQSLILLLSNEGNMPINKIKRTIEGITDGQINPCEGYISKLQERAYENLKDFEDELIKNVIQEKLIYWDDTVINVDTKRACLRFYGTDKLALYKAHENKDKKGLDEDKILTVLDKNKTVMHDHNMINYNKCYSFSNIECNVHLIRDLQKNSDNSGHEWSKKLKALLSDANAKRNELISKNISSFEQEYLDKFFMQFDIIMRDAIDEKNSDDKWFKSNEQTLILRILKYRENYLAWVANFDLPFTNNLSERSLRDSKSKMKISGQFENINSAKKYARIKSYIETCHRNSINEYSAINRLSLKRPLSVKEILNGQIN